MTDSKPSAEEGAKFYPTYEQREQLRSELELPDSETYLSRYTLDLEAAVIALRAAAEAAMDRCISAVCEYYSDGATAIVEVIRKLEEEG